MDYLHRFTTFLIELLWPHRCSACGQGSSVACARCLWSFVAPAPSKLRFRYLDSLHIATSLTPTVQSFVYTLKYRGVRDLAAPLADRMCDLLAPRHSTRRLCGSNPLFIPVPLHSTRLRERGFNQAELLARRLTTTIAMPLDITSLIRSRATHQQAKQSHRSERFTNIEGAFAAPENAAILNRDIVLIDDVATTGATLDDCARALKSAGARTVSAIVLAHG